MNYKPQTGFSCRPSFDFAPFGAEPSFDTEPQDEVQGRRQDKSTVRRFYLGSRVGTMNHEPLLPLDPITSPPLLPAVSPG